MFPALSILSRLSRPIRFRIFGFCFFDCRLLRLCSIIPDNPQNIFYPVGNQRYLTVNLIALDIYPVRRSKIIRHSACGQYLLYPYRDYNQPAVGRQFNFP